MSGAPSIATVNTMLAARMGDLARDLAGDPASRGRDEWRYGRRGSLSVMVAGAKRGMWSDHEAGCGGDPLGLVAHLRRCPMAEAFRWALVWLGEDAANDYRPAAAPAVAPPEAPREASPPASLDLAWSMWGEAMPADTPGSLVPVYLASRGLALPDARGVLRFHPRAWRNRANGPHGPAMVAEMTDPATNEWTGTHVTYLRPGGVEKADGPSCKIMLGRVGCIRLVEDAEVTMGLGIAEGIETSLAVMQGFDWRPVWAATSAGAIRRFPVLPGIGALTIFADTDGAGINAAHACAARWTEAGRGARIYTPPAGDFNDMIREHAA